VVAAHHQHIDQPASDELEVVEVGHTLGRSVMEVVLLDRVGDAFA